MQKCDVLVVGGGPAGGTAAMAAAQAGASVIIVEKRSRIGKPVQCGEYIPKALLRELKLKPDFIAQPLEAMHTILPDGTLKKTRIPGCTIDRAVFDAAIIDSALEKGAKLIKGTRALGIEGNHIRLSSGEIVEPAVIIGADGPKSTVAKWMGLPEQDLLAGIQTQVKLVCSLPHTEVYFQKQFKHGYGWLFPKGQYANLGLGARMNGKAFKNSLIDFYKFLLDRGIIQQGLGRTTTGFIPVGGPRPCVYKNMVLAGDAAGHTHAITGAGIANAVLCGKMAGKWSARAVLEKNIGLLYEYETEWKEYLGDEMNRAVERRRVLEENWENLNNVIRSCWTVFRDYYTGTACPL